MNQGIKEISLVASSEIKISMVQTNEGNAIFIVFIVAAVLWLNEVLEKLEDEELYAQT